MVEERPVVHRRNLPRFVGSFTRLVLSRRKPKDQWCQLLDAVAEKIVMVCARDGKEHTMALDRVCGPKVRRVRLFRMELLDGAPSLDEVEVLADTGWVEPGDHESLAQGLEQIVLAAAHAGLPRRELARRVARTEQESP